MYHKLLTALRTLPGRRRRDTILRNLIRGRRVLILGSGPSVQELKSIPEDTLVFSCNFGPQALLEKKLPLRVDLYICTRQILTDKKYLNRIESLLQSITINIFIFKKPHFLKETRITNYTHALYNDSASDRFTKLLPVQGENKNNATENKFSNGIRLLEYALYYKAKEVYLAGMDMHGKGYGIKNADDNSIYEKVHATSDLHFIEMMCKKYHNVYTAVPSPVTRWIPLKELI